MLFALVNRVEGNSEENVEKHMMKMSDKIYYVNFCPNLDTSLPLHT